MVTLGWFVCPSVSMVNTSMTTGLEKILLTSSGDGGMGGGGPMLHVDYKKGQCHLVEFKKSSCRHVDFKKVPCPL